MTIIINLDIYLTISISIIGTLYAVTLLFKNTKKIGSRYWGNESTYIIGCND